MLLKRFDPPAFANDFEAIPGQMEAWSDMISQAFDASIQSVETPDQNSSRNAPGVGAGKSQYYNATKTDTKEPYLDLAITWLGFPRTLTVQYGRDQALREVDRLQPLNQHPYFAGNSSEQLDGLFYRPQDEYCEWHATRDDFGKITRVVFTSEAPEYWSAMGGGYPSSFYFSGERHIDAKGDPDKVVALYRQLVSPDVQKEDLFFQDDARSAYFAKGDYNPYNKWNTTHGIVHLTQPANTLLAEIQLGADGTILRSLDGQLLVDADQIIAVAAYGGMNRSSDPNIGFSVNQLARLGAMVTISNPVGLYMSNLDTMGWTKPDGKTPVGDYWKIVRGTPGRILRAVYEVPKEEGFTVGDILIGGVPIRWPGQIAEHITVTLIGRAFVPLGRAANPPLAGHYSPIRRQINPLFLAQSPVGKPPRAGFEPANPGVGVSQPAPTASPVEDTIRHLAPIERLRERLPAPKRPSWIAKRTDHT